MKNKRIILIISILLIIGFLGTSLISFFVSRFSMIDQIKSSQLPLTSDNIYSEIQRDLLQPIFISSLMSNDTFLRDWIINDEKDVDKITKYLNEIKVKYNAFTSFFVSDKTLNYYYASGILKKVNSKEPRDNWYFRVKEMKDTFEINVDPDMANKDTMTIFINYKVFDYNNNYIGATGVGLNVSAVKQLMESFQARYNCNAYFVDKKGKVVLYGSGYKIENFNINEIKELGVLAEEIFSTKANYFNYKKNSSVIHLYTRYIPEFQWYLFVEEAESHFVKGIFYTLTINLIICIIISVIILFITYLTLSSFQNSLEKMAITDKLTGVYNRRIIDINLKQVIKENQRNKIPFSIIILDIDHFKKINDSYGHLAGDAVLCSITDIIKSVIRDSDVLSRWGGDEFIILLKNCKLGNALAVAEKMRVKVKENSTIFADNKIKNTISIGVTQYKETDNENDMFARADQFLYRAKKRGRDKVESG